VTAQTGGVRARMQTTQTTTTTIATTTITTMNVEGMQEAEGSSDVTAVALTMRAACR
jgi:hypothetical protein